MCFVGEIDILQACTSCRANAKPFGVDQFTIIKLIKIVSMIFWFKGFEKTGYFKFFLRITVLVNPGLDGFQFLFVFFFIDPEVRMLSFRVFIARVVEEGHRFVVFIVYKWIVWMRMTLDASHRGTLP